MNYLRQLTIIFLLLLSFPSFSIEREGISLSNVEVNCESEYRCEEFSKKFKSLMDVKTWTLESLREKLRFLTLDRSIENFYFSIDSNSGHLKVYVKRKERIQEISYKSNRDLDMSSISQLVPFREGHYYDYRNEDQLKERIKKYLEDRGYAGIEINISREKTKNEDGINILVSIQIESVTRITKIEVKGANKILSESLERRLKKYRGGIWDRVKLKIEVDEIKNELFNEGYFYSSVEDTVERINKNSVKIGLNIKYGERFNFYFRGVNVFSRAEMIEIIRKSLKNNVGQLDLEEIKRSILTEYQKIGLYETKANIYSRKGETRQGSSFINYYFNLEEGRKIHIESLDFIGVYKLGEAQVKDIFYDNASVLSSRNYLDKDFINNFSDILKNEYLKRGFVFIEVSKPLVIIDDQELKAKVEYRVKEGQQTILQKINFEGIDESFASELKKNLTNKQGEPLDVTKVESDLEKVLLEVRNRGYYFASLGSANDRYISYSSNYTEATLDININLGKKAIVEDILITGHIETKSEVIQRELWLDKGDLITPKNLVEARDRLTSLGLFSFVRISPFVVSRSSSDEFYRVNLLIQVQEKKFGSGEVAPGYRTDLGIKVSTGVSYNNFMGMNRIMSLRAQTNLRTNYSSLDARRRAEEKQLLEWLLKVNYKEPYLLPGVLKFKRPVEWDSSVSHQRKRFFGFDADIAKVQTSLSKALSEKVSASLLYKLEIINQYNATEEKDREFFRIGSLTPTISLDLRDTPITPRKGAFFSLSWEFANQYFLSMHDENDLVIDFNRLISRNQFYIPLKNWVFAFSFSMGVEKNFATDPKLDENGNIQYRSNGSVETQGFIPSIKVFRLDGIDTVRGFSDNEINRLERGDDIGSVVIDNEAYFANFKFEPRYYFNDNLIMALFFDAGRVFVNHFKPLDLRTAVGTGFKFRTPVGTLDFDYGVKLKRMRFDDQTREDFGRFHFSIGFF